MICLTLEQSGLPVGHVLEVETPAGQVVAVVHPLTLSEPARRILGVTGDVVQVAVEGRSGVRGRATLLARGDDVVMRLWDLGMSHVQAEALAKVLYNLLTWDDPDAVADEVFP